MSKTKKIKLSHQEGTHRAPHRRSSQQIRYALSIADLIQVCYFVSRGQPQ